MASVVFYYFLLLLLPLLYLVKSRLSSANNGLRLPPGPWQLPIIGSLHHLRDGLLHRALRDLSKRYGPVMFLKFGEVPVVVISPREAAREVMSIVTKFPERRGRGTGSRNEERRFWLIFTGRGR
ncbi:unnamed protein product [Urochloa humidicola]